jgi:hypothetical protein
LVLHKTAAFVFFLFFVQAAFALEYAGVFALFEVFIACIPREKKERESGGYCEDSFIALCTG